MAWADGYLWVGEYRAAKIHQIDAKTGEVVKTLSSDRFVTGVPCLDGELWHATTGDAERPGLEGDGKGGFWCGGGAGGKLRLVKKRS